MMANPEPAALPAKKNTHATVTTAKTNKDLFFLMDIFPSSLHSFCQFRIRIERER
jgi:hypothetical protein